MGKEIINIEDDYVMSKDTPSLTYHVPLTTQQLTLC